MTNDAGKSFADQCITALNNIKKQVPDGHRINDYIISAITAFEKYKSDLKAHPNNNKTKLSPRKKKKS